MEKVVKRTIGYGKPKENENYTHVIYTEDEHNKKEQKIRELEYKIEKLEREYKSAIESVESPFAVPCRIIRQFKP